MKYLAISHSIAEQRHTFSAVSYRAGPGFE